MSRSGPSSCSRWERLSRPLATSLRPNLQDLLCGGPFENRTFYSNMTSVILAVALRGDVATLFISKISRIVSSDRMRVLWYFGQRLGLCATSWTLD